MYRVNNSGRRLCSILPMAGLLKPMVQWTFKGYANDRQTRMERFGFLPFYPRWDKSWGGFRPAISLSPSTFRGPIHEHSNLSDEKTTQGISGWSHIRKFMYLWWNLTIMYRDTKLVIFNPSTLYFSNGVFQFYGHL